MKNAYKKKVIREFSHEKMHLYDFFAVISMLTYLFNRIHSGL